MTDFPWQKPVAFEVDSVETNDDTFTAQETNDETYDPFMFVRIRIRHGDVIRFVGIRADDSDITGRIKLDNGTEIVVSVWGVPTKSEPFMKSTDVIREIIKYVKENRLTVL